MIDGTFNFVVVFIGLVKQEVPSTCKLREQKIIATDASGKWKFLIVHVRFVRCWFKEKVYDVERQYVLWSNGEWENYAVLFFILCGWNIWNQLLRQCKRYIRFAICWIILWHYWVKFLNSISLCKLSCNQLVEFSFRNALRLLNIFVTEIMYVNNILLFHIAWKYEVLWTTAK